jgi:fumarate hydratase class II
MARDAPDPDPAMRIEHDSMGEVAVPAAAKWQAQTQRAVENFPISGRPIHPRLVRALGAVKAEAARTNGELGTLAVAVAAAIAAAADEVADGRWDAEFPGDVFQTGSGTSSNMNANEVIATLAAERSGLDVHPNDHVNLGQSSNDVFPSAIHVAAVGAVAEDVVPALDHLAAALRERSAALADVVKSGRTHLMDATPVTLGQELGGWASQMERAAERLTASLPRAGSLPLGGTAVGTGINCPPGFAAGTIRRLAERTGLPLSEATDHFAAQGARDDLVELSGQVRAAAVGLSKVADDIRWLSSGPRAGLAELHLPDLQPGSSIMPGKVNPVLCEAVLQVCAQVIGADAAVAWGGARGNLELNVMLPVLARNLLEACELLANVARLFADRCVAGIEADVERCRAYAEASPAVATALNPLLGYETVAALVKEAAVSGRTVRELVLERDLVDPATLDRTLDVLAMTRAAPPEPDNSLADRPPVE